MQISNITPLRVRRTQNCSSLSRNNRFTHYTHWRNSVAVLKLWMQMSMSHFSSDRLIYVREDVKEWGVTATMWCLCYLCWHGVFSCASVSFPVSELCTHCPHNERNGVSRCLPAPASSLTQYVIIGFLYTHAIRVLLYFPLRTKMEITRVREISGTIKCALKNDLQNSESHFVCLIQPVAYRGGGF